MLIRLVAVLEIAQHMQLEKARGRVFKWSNAVAGSRSGAWPRASHCDLSGPTGVRLLILAPGGQGADSVGASDLPLRPPSLG